MACNPERIVPELLGRTGARGSLAGMVRWVEGRVQTHFAASQLDLGGVCPSPPGSGRRKPGALSGWREQFRTALVAHDLNTSTRFPLQTKPTYGHCFHRSNYNHKGTDAGRRDFPEHSARVWKAVAGLLCLGPAALDMVHLSHPPHQHGDPPLPQGDGWAMSSGRPVRALACTASLPPTISEPL